MRLLILGGDGMLGHECLLGLADSHEVFVTLRQSHEHYQAFGLYHDENSRYQVDVSDLSMVESVIADVRPEAIINAVGVVKQRLSAQNPVVSITINALFPHQLSLLAKKYQARVIHFSTDCVFTGDKGNYTEADFADANDLYGRSKFLGELSESHCVTIRSSLIGLELANHASLIEWFLAQKGTIEGFSRALYTGLTTMEMCRVVDTILRDHPALHGVYQVTSQPINKYDLLNQLNKKLQRQDLSIQANNSFSCNRNLVGDKFTQATGYVAPSWDDMLTELATHIFKRQRCESAQSATSNAVT